MINLKGMANFIGFPGFIEQGKQRSPSIDDHVEKRTRQGHIVFKTSAIDWFLVKCLRALGYE
jgi:hypothetical protein